MSSATEMRRSVRKAVNKDLSICSELHELVRNVQQTVNDRILRLPQMKAKTGHAVSTIWKYVKNGTLPPPIRLGPRSVGWLESEIDAVIAAQVFASRSRQVIDMKAFVSLLASANESARRTHSVAPNENEPNACSTKEIQPTAVSPSDDEWGLNDPPPSDEEHKAVQRRLKRLNSIIAKKSKPIPLDRRSKTIEIAPTRIIKTRGASHSLSELLRKGNKADIK